jgi:hypothetical protein
MREPDKLFVAETYAVQQRPGYIKFGEMICFLKPTIDGQKISFFLRVNPQRHLVGKLFALRQIHEASL